MTPADINDHVILVDAQDREIGTAPKLPAHRDGRLHRAISVQILDRSGRLLLQKRQVAKYHSGGLWTNTCCSHPRPGESAFDAAHRRLQEEMGIATPLRPLFTTTYRAALDNGLIEHEFVHVFGGVHGGAVVPHPDEADGFEWTTIETLRTSIAQQPDRYTAWFRIYLRDHWDMITAQRKGY
jgi:isopentenyl-diphosphate Delta-isomerase